MKKLLIILALVCTAAVVYGQYEDVLPIKSTSLATDTLRVVKDGESGLMLRSVMLSDINSDLTTHEADGTNPHLVTANQIGLGSVENTALSTWPGSTYITTLGTILTGVWNGTALTNAYLPTALTGKTYNGVTLTAAGLATVYLNGAGGYTTPPGSGSYIFSNGLTEASDTVKLGGPLTSGAIFTGPAYSVSFGQSGTKINSLLAYTTTTLLLDSDGGAVLSRGETDKYISIQGSAITIGDAEDSQGMKYLADYSTNGISTYGNRWIPDYGTVLTAIGASGGVASSGTNAQYDIPYWADAGVTLTSKTAAMYITSTSGMEETFNLKAKSIKSGIYLSQDGSNKHFLGSDSTNEDIFQVWAAGTLSLSGSSGMVMPSLTSGTSTNQLFYNPSTGAITQGTALSGYTAANGLTLNSTAFELGGTMSRATTIDVNGFDLFLGDSNGNGITIDASLSNTIMERVSSDGYKKAYMGTIFTNPTEYYEAYMISDDYYFNNKWSKIGLQSDTAYINFGFGTTDNEFMLTDGKMFADVGTAVTSSTLYYNTTTEEVTYGAAPVSSDTVSISDISHMLVDTLQFVFPAKGTLVAGDIMNVFEQVQDSIVFDAISVECVGTSADITLQVQYGATWTSTGTGIHTALQVTTAGGEATTTTFSTAIVGPGNDIWCEPTIVATSPTMVILKLFYHEKRVD